MDVCQFLTITHVFSIDIFDADAQLYLVYIYIIYIGLTLESENTIAFECVTSLVCCCCCCWSGVRLHAPTHADCRHTVWVALTGLSLGRVCALAYVRVCTHFDHHRAPESEALNYTRQSGLFFFSRLSSRYYLFICVSVGHVAPNMMDI